VCKINFPTTFREPLWVPSSMVISYSEKFKIGPTAASETSSGNLSFTPRKIPETKNQCSFHCEGKGRVFPLQAIRKVKASGFS
jgi:hypothetical protein